jgi:2-beta-glucuronyltransferase
VHHLARAYARAGRDVLFLVVNRSWLGDWIRGRVAPANVNRLVSEGRITSYLWRTPWHPLNLRAAALNRLATPLARRYGRFPLGAVEPLVAEAEMVLFDTGAGLMLVDRVRALAPGVRLVYRASDDVRYAGVHPAVVEAEARALAHFDLISSPCAAIHVRFADRPSARLHHHGIDRLLFDRASASPYAATRGPHAVYVGRHPVDSHFLAAASALRPEWTFHVIGPGESRLEHDNVRTYGELPFAETVPFIRHADVGLHPVERGPGAETFTDSLKVIQYTYCRLPIVAPSFLRGTRPNMIGYEPGDRESIDRALTAARDLDRSRIDTSGIRSWDELAAELAG